MPLYKYSSIPLQNLACQSSSFFNILDSHLYIYIDFQTIQYARNLRFKKEFLDAGNKKHHHDV